jgi:Putative polyhydroxyalkanoic acid system protein (PHA_gran_rgn)
MPQFSRKYPGKNADEIYARVDQTMAQMAQKHSLAYQKDEAGKSGKVSRMGMAGTYQVRDGEVTVDLKFPMIVPGSLKKTVEDAIQKRLDSLFA